MNDQRVDENQEKIKKTKKYEWKRKVTIYFYLFIVHKK